MLMHIRNEVETIRALCSSGLYTETMYIEARGVGLMWNEYHSSRMVASLSMAATYTHPMQQNLQLANVP